MKKRKHHPLRALFLVLALLLAGIWFFFDQQNRLQPEELIVTAPRLPAAFDGLRVALISDFHGKEFGEGNQTLLDAVAEQKPDIIALTGDIIDDPSQFHMISPVATGLAAIAPTYYVTGNHEWATGQARTVKALLGECGVTVLSNEYLPLERDGETIILAGIDDPNGPYDQKTPGELADEIRAQYGDPYILLLAHRNEYYKVYDRAGYDLTLCGHAHGGLIRLPFTDGLLGNDRKLFPNHTAGLYSTDSGVLAVSRGLGNNTVPIPSFRLFNRPHLPLIILNRPIGGT